jgi:hypothetical protein
MRSKLMAAMIVGMLCLTGCGGGGGLASSSSGSSSGGSSSGGSSSGGNGGGSGTSSGNVQSVVVDSGPTVIANSNSPSVNTLYTQVTICVPGTSNCQTIDHIQVDTGSSGLRILGSVLTLSGLPTQNAAGGSAIAECVQFVDGSSWGPLRVADVKISGETASSQTIQVIGDANYSSVPGGCSGTAENTVTAFGANGILGVGPFIQDCGPNCANAATNIYYTCTTPNACAESAIPLNLQTSNPVASFATDNNGVIIELPAVASTSTSVSGSLIFGIGTQSNNGLGTAAVLTLDSNGAFVTTYKGTALHESFIDSGSNALYFPDSTINTCADNSVAPGFFCPGTTLSLSATMTGANGQGAQINFNLGDAVAIFSGNSVIAAASTLGASIAGVNPSDPTFTGNDTFDWGLPFYFGRNVYTAIETKNTSAGAGPYFAF